MSLGPPAHADVRRLLKARLLELSPRAFELFSGDLLVYVGLQNIEVTRYVGDGGIDAHGDLIAESGLARVPTGVQVKRHRHNIQRADIDRFIGALAGQYRHGIFITTAYYAEQARAKAISSPAMLVDAVDGDQLVRLMLRHQLGLSETPSVGPRVDEAYFTTFESQASRTSTVRERQATYEVGVAGSLTISPDDDLISLHALSYILRVDTTTITNWIERGKLLPDNPRVGSGTDGFFFRRNRVDTIRRDLVRTNMPETGVEWRQQFLDFAHSRSLTKSYKPVLLKAILKLVDRSGAVKIDNLVQEFRAFYLLRQQAGEPVEFGVPLLADPATASHDAIKRLIVQNPLDRFIIKGFLEYSSHEGTVRFVEQLWNELRFYELLDVQASVNEQLRYYYTRKRQS